MNQLDKSDKIKIQIRKDFLSYAHKKIDSIQIGDMTPDEYEILRQELSDIIDFLADKDKYIAAMDYYKKYRRNPHINKFFKER